MFLRVIIKKWRNPERLNHKKISVKIFNLAATFILNIHGGTNIENMRSLTRRIMGQLIILCQLLQLKCQCSHKQTFYHLISLCRDVHYLNKVIYNTDHKPYKTRVLSNFFVTCVRENCLK